MAIRSWITQVASSLFFDNDGTGFTATNVQDAIIEAQTIAIGLAEIQAFNDDSTQSTTSNGWVTKSNFPWTTAMLPAGDYVVTFSAELGQSDKEKNVGYRVQWREGTSGTWLDLTSIVNGLSIDDGYELRTGFRVITVSSTSVIQVRVQFGQTDEGGTGRIRNAGVSVTRKSV